MRTVRTMLLSVPVTVLIIGGCPTPSSEDSLRPLPPASGIPSGTFRGEATIRIVTASGETLLSDVMESSPFAITIEDGRLINESTGQPWKVGDRGDLGSGTLSIVSTTTSITAVDDAIVEEYDVEWRDSRGLLLTGQGRDQYVLDGDQIAFEGGFIVSDPQDEGSTTTLTWGWAALLSR